MKHWRLIIFFFLTITLSGCSFQRYFILGNATDQTISVQYTLETPMEESAIFGKEGEIYQSYRDYSPNWEHPLPYRDLNSSDQKVSIQLGPKSTLVFGTLSNDQYDALTMKSSSGKLFNLVEMTFSSNGIDYVITKDNFHDFFLEDGGTYKYVIQP